MTGAPRHAVVFKLWAMAHWWATDSSEGAMDMQDKQTIFFNDPLWEPRLALRYLTDIFHQLNKLNLKIQGKDTAVIHFVDTAYFCR